MALQPSLRPLIIAGHPNAPHTLEIFLDYVCPYSAKMAFAINNILKPAFESGKFKDQAKVVFRPQVQPWHATSTFTHEAGLAVLRAAPQHFWDFSLALFKAQDQYFDGPTADLTATQIRDNLVKLAQTVVSPGEAEQVRGLLKLTGASNGGNAVLDDLKYTIKISRQNGIHVSPTALWDGLIANEISSGWGEAEWNKFLEAKVKL